MIRLKYLTRANRWTALHDIALLSELSDRAQSPLWHELLRDYGIRDIASLVLRDRFGTWGFLALWREGRDFDPAEAAHLARLTTPITTALRRAQAATFVVRPPEAPRPGPLVLLLSPRGRAVADAARRPAASGGADDRRHHRGDRTGGAAGRLHPGLRTQPARVRTPRRRDLLTRALGA